MPGAVLGPCLEVGDLAVVLGEQVVPPHEAIEGSVVVVFERSVAADNPLPSPRHCSEGNHLKRWAARFPSCLSRSPLSLSLSLSLPHPPPSQRMKSLALVLLWGACAAFAAPAPSLPRSTAAFNCTGTPNRHPVWTQDPVLVTTVPNGALYHAGNATHNISVVHLYGTAYQLG